MPRAARPVEQEVFVNLVRTSGRLVGGLSRALRPYGLSEPQFNVLRILRGAGPSGLPCQAIGERLISRAPDITRLLDRMFEAGLIERTRSDDDRRVVVSRLAKKGRRVLQQLDQPVEDLHRRQFSALTGAELRELGRLLHTVAER